LDLGCGRWCRDGFHGGGTAYPGTDMAESLALFNAWIAQFPPPAGWYLANPIAALSGWTVTQPPCNAWYMNTMYPNVAFYCPTECTTTRNTIHLWRYDVTDPAEKYHATGAARDAARNARNLAFNNAFNAWWASSAPPIRWAKGDCEYELTPNSGTLPLGSSGDIGCVKYVSTNPLSQRWVFCTAVFRFMPRTYWTVSCAQEPCTMADYNWPTSIPCNCQSHYLDSDLTTAPPPPCTLHLMSTRREFSGDKCYFIARYGGAIEAGVITCPPATTDPTCICCSEPP